MSRGNIKKFTAALLCGVMFFTNVAPGQMVYASPAGEEALEKTKMLPEEVAEEPEISENTEETGVSEEPGEPAADQEEPDDPGDTAEDTVPEDDPGDMSEETVPEDDTKSITPMAERGAVEDNGEWQLDGQCGENVSYSLGTSWEWNEETGESYEIECLKIYGDGDMYDYASDKELGESGESVLPPWYGFRDRITQIRIEDNVTSIGDWAFANCTNLNFVSMRSIRKIGAGAFSGCMNLNHVTVLASEIQNHAFEGSGLRSIRIEDYECMIYEDELTFPRETIIFGQDGSTAQAYAATHGNMFFVPDGRCRKENEFPEMPENELYYSMEWDDFSNAGTLHIHSPHQFTIEMGDYTLSEVYPSGPDAGSLPPWYEFRDLIESVVIDSNTPNIGNWAFADCKNLRSVTTRKNIIKIGQGAFSGCESLEKIDLPENIAEIQDRAFENAGLSSIEILNWDCYISMDEFTFPENTEIRGYPESTAQKYADAFGRPFIDLFPGYFDGLSGTCGDTTQYTVDLETGILSISGEGNMYDYTVRGEEPVNPGENPDDPETELQPVMEQEPPWYKYRKKIQSVVIEDGVTSIGNGAFVNLGISHIDIPQSVTNIGEYAFWYCKSLETVALPDGITTIKSNTFNKCSNLINISIPNSLASIGERAFSQCENLSEILLPENLGSIGSYAFENCSSLTDITIPEKVNVIEDGVFYGCNSIRNLSLHDGIISIGGSAFSNCRNWENISVPLYVTYIGNDAFYNCDKLKNVTIPKSMTKIESRTFRNCGNLTNITIPETITSIGTYAFEDCSSLEEIIIPDSVINIGDGAFEFCRNLKKITLPKGLTTINRYMFEFCDNLEEITIPEKVTSINYYAFYYCHKLKNITIPESVTTLEDRAFYSCNQLTEIKILNPSCIIYDSSSTISSTAVIHGYKSSTAESYAKKYNRKFTVIELPRPEKLSGLTAVGDLYQIVLSWTISHEIDSTKYRIYRRADDETNFERIKEINNRNTLGYTDTDVEVNKTYEYYVVSVNKYSMESEPTAIQSAAAYPDDERPTVVQLTPASGSRIGASVQLYARAEDNVGVTKTELHISTDDGNTWNLLHTSNSDICRYLLDTKVYGDTKIQVKCLAYDAAGNVSNDNSMVCTYQIDTTGPEKTEGLTYESTSATITLRWNDVKDNDFSFFRVEQLTDNGSYSKVQDVYTTLGANIYDLKADTDYQYRVVAYDQLGNRGEPSDPISARTQKDTIAPVVTEIKPGAGYCTNSITSRIKASDSSGISSILIQTSEDAILWDDYKKIAFTGNNKTETAAETIKLDAFEEGFLYIRGVAEDTAGNISDTSDAAPYVQYIIDRTAPSVPQNFTSNATTGAIELRWDMGKEADLNTYTIYRSTDGIAYSVLAGGLRSLNYWDRSVEKDTVYHYKLAVCDLAGNVSEKTEAVQGQLPEDTIDPEIKSYAPASGSTIGWSNNTFSVMASDNWKVDTVTVRYTVNNDPTEKTLIHEQGINVYYKVLSKAIPLSGLQDGDVLHFTISVTDIQGRTVTKDGIIYNIDKTAPQVNSISAEGDTEKITIRWTGNAEGDLAGYRIYRKSASGYYQMIAQRSVHGTSYLYEDYNALPKETYYYKVEAVDKFGNTHTLESEAVCLTVVPEIKAAFTCNTIMEVDIEYLLDASASRADLGICSYSFDFGDGTAPLTGNNAKVTHTYGKAGAYTVTLTVTDEAGTTSTAKKEITVEEARMLGTVAIKVVDVNGNVLPKMPVYFDLDNTSDNVKYTDSKGNASFTANVGRYAVGAYKDGYLPVKKTVVTRANTEIRLELTMVKEPIVTGEFEVHRMTLDEIIAAGIDVKNPANQQVVKITIRLTYGTTPVSLDIVTNGSSVYSGETTIVDTDEGRRRLTVSVVTPSSGGGSTGGIGSLPDNFDIEDAIVAIMDAPVEASCLKEFFDVKLHIFNHADTQFELTDNVVTLHVPGGMSLVETVDTDTSATVRFDSLKGQEEKTIHWTLRGDTAGEYDLTADYSAVLSQFNANVSATFKTEEPIKVYGLEAIKLIADINMDIAYGGMYFDLSLQNVGGADMNLPTLDILNNVITVYEKKKEDESASSDYKGTLKVLNTILKNASGYSQNLKPDEEIRTLSSGETYTKKYVYYGSVQSTDLTQLQDAICEIADGQGIQVEINKVNMDLFSANDAEEKVKDIFNDDVKKSAYNYLIDSNNYYYYLQALDDESFLTLLGQAFYRSTDCVLNLNWDLFTHDTEKDVARQYIYELLKDESFQKAVDAKIDLTYLKVARSAVGTVQGMLADDKWDETMGYDLPVSQNALKEFSGYLSEKNNMIKLSKALAENGEEGFTDRLITAAESCGGAALAEGIKVMCEKNVVSDTIASELKSELTEAGKILGVINDVCDAWNKSVEITNQLVKINAAQSQALALTEYILSNEAIKKTKTYEAVQEIHDGLVDGFKSQSTILAEELQKKIVASAETKLVNKVVIATIDKKFYDTSFGYGSVATVMATLKAAFGIADYIFGWQDSANVYTNLRVAGLLSLALEQTTTKFRDDSENASDFLFSLKYLVKIRLLGEQTYVKLISEFKGVNSDYDPDKVLESINKEGHNRQYSSLNEYYLFFKETILAHRDAVFGEITVSAQKPEAPQATIDYRTEQTKEFFSSKYEYSYDGVNWTGCDGAAIPLYPGSTGQHLWIRVKETKENFAGNITKIYIPARRLLTDDITARYKNGIYYIEGANGLYYYDLSDQQVDEISKQFQFEAVEGTVVNIEKDGYHTFLSVAVKASGIDFSSRVRNVPVERPKTVFVTGDPAAGTVRGAGEYFAGEEVTIEAVTNEGYTFAGWYEEDTLVSSEPVYRFVIGSDMDLEARYTAAVHVHHGGTATCTKQAVCEDCQQPYGEPDANNHAGGTEVRNQKNPTCTEAGYTGDTYCKGCGAKLADGKTSEKTPHAYEDGICKNCQAKDPAYEEHPKPGPEPKPEPKPEEPDPKPEPDPEEPEPVPEPDFRFSVQGAEKLYYTGSAQKPDVQVYKGEQLLHKGIDYTLAYANNVNADQTGAKGGFGSSLSDASNGFDSALPYVIITGKGCYTDTVYLNFHISPVPLSDEQGGAAEGFTLSCADQLTVNAKKAQKPFRSLKYRKVLTADDYTVELIATDAFDAGGNTLEGTMEDAKIPAGASGTFRLVIAGKGNYTGTLEQSIHVSDKKHLMKNAVVTLGKNAKSRPYTGEAITLVPGYYDTQTGEYYKVTEGSQTEKANKQEVFTVRIGKTYLVYGKDYTARYEDNLAVGTASLILEGMGEYTGTKESSFQITGIDLSAKNVTIEGLVSCIYTGSAVEPEDIILTYHKGASDEKQLVNGKDYVAQYKNNVSKGKASVTFLMQPASGYTGKITKTFRITAAALNETLLSESSRNLTVPYTKTGVRPEPELFYHGVRLHPGTDYKVSYINNKAVAAAIDSNTPTMKITGKGNYTETFNVTFNICQASLDDEGTVGIQIKETAFNQKKPETYVYAPQIKVLDGTKTLKSGKDYTVAFYNNTQAQVTTYYEALKNGTDASVLASLSPYAEVKAREESNYTGSVTVPLPIYETRLSSKNLYVVVSSDESERIWTGDQVTPPVSVYYGELSIIKQLKSSNETNETAILQKGLSRLEKGIDYTVTYGVNITAGKNKGSVTVKGLAPFFGGSISVKFTILSQRLNNPYHFDTKKIPDNVPGFSLFGNPFEIIDKQ